MTEAIQKELRNKISKEISAHIDLHHSYNTMMEKIMDHVINVTIPQEDWVEKATVTIMAELINSKIDYPVQASFTRPVNNNRFYHVSDIMDAVKQALRSLNGEGK